MCVSDTLLLHRQINFCYPNANLTIILQCANIINRNIRIFAKTKEGHKNNIGSDSQNSHRRRKEQHGRKFRPARADLVAVAAKAGLDKDEAETVFEEIEQTIKNK